MTNFKDHDWLNAQSGILDSEEDIAGIAFTIIEGVDSFAFGLAIESLIQSEFKAARIAVGPVAFIGAANNGCFLAVVPEWRTALPVLESVARRINMKAYAEIAYYDREELFWRSVVSRSGLPFDRFVNDARIAEAAAGLNTQGLASFARATAEDSRIAARRQQEAFSGESEGEA